MNQLRFSDADGSYRCRKDCNNDFRILIEIVSLGFQKHEQQDGEQNEEESDEQQEGEESKPSESEMEQNWSEEDAQAMEQWLRRIPDDPGGLLRRKFRNQHQRRGAPADESEKW